MCSGSKLGVVVESAWYKESADLIKNIAIRQGRFAILRNDRSVGVLQGLINELVVLNTSDRLSCQGIGEAPSAGARC